jgi:hypothetical protein
MSMKTSESSGEAMYWFEQVVGNIDTGQLTAALRGRISPMELQIVQWLYPLFRQCKDMSTTDLRKRGTGWRTEQVLSTLDKLATHHGYEPRRGWLFDEIWIEKRPDDPAWTWIRSDWRTRGILKLVCGCEWNGAHEAVLSDFRKLTVPKQNCGSSSIAISTRAKPSANNQRS